jgi:diacylglycerol kinase (ATP)
LSSVNKPKFNVFKNVTYAMQGAVTVLKSEKSFKTQLLVIAIIALVLPFLSLSTVTKFILFFSTWIILVAEAFNSAIERVVDLVTQDYHQLAKEAKDIGSFGVLLAFILIAAIWFVTLYLEFNG